MRVVPESPEVVTASMDGVVKVWDLRTYKCRHTINTVPHEEAGNDTATVQCMEYCASRKTIVVGSRDVKYLKQKPETEHGEVACLDPVTAALYNPHLGVILTVEGTTVRIWYVPMPPRGVWLQHSKASFSFAPCCCCCCQVRLHWDPPPSVPRPHQIPHYHCHTWRARAEIHFGLR